MKSIEEIPFSLVERLMIENNALRIVAESLINETNNEKLKEAARRALNMNK